MWKNTFKCNLCNRPMPPRIFPAHLKKSHDINDPKVKQELEVYQAGLIGKMSKEEIAGKIEFNDKELEKLQVKFDNQTKKLGEVFTEQIIKNKPFDWGEVYPCSSCGEEYPAKAMPFHSWVKHRV